MSYLTHLFSVNQQAASELARQQEWFIKARRDHDKREVIAEKKEEATSSLGGEVLIATEIQLRKFNLKLDEYEAATTAALMANQKQLDVVSAQIDLLLAQAFIMPDGRRVFRTEDGTQVFDEHGEEVSPGELDFLEIPDDAPSWEEFSEQLSQQTRLKLERNQLNTYQDKLDDARDLAVEGEISENELAELEADLDSMMPITVRRELPPIENADVAPKVGQEFSAHAAGEVLDVQSMDMQLDDLIPR